jgi:uncharacterized protein YecE (DUF72 family)
VLPAVRAQRAHPARRQDLRRHRVHLPDRGEPGPRGSRPDAGAGLRRARAGRGVRELRAAGAPRLKSVRVGCSGWAYKEWRGSFYPEKLPQRLWLEHYATRFDTVEVNSTFYGLPKPETVNTWIEQTPDDFRFSVKASRYITHVKRLKSPEKYVERFLAAIEPLRAADRIEAVLWQLPPSFKRDDERLAAALDAIAERAPGRHVVELRNATWFTQDVYSLLNQHGAALAIVDDPALPFVERSLKTPWAYVRLHRGSRGAYSDEDLATWRRRIAAWRSRTDVLVYFNNTETAAAENAAALRARLS